MPTNNTDLERNLWAAADELRANSKLRAADYSIPVLGLIFLKYADHKFAHATEQFKAEAAEPSRRRRRRDPLSPDRYKAAGVLYIPDEARYQHLVEVPEGENIGRRIHDAMKAIEEHNKPCATYCPRRTSASRVRSCVNCCASLSGFRWTSAPTHRVELFISVLPWQTYDARR